MYPKITLKSRKKDFFKNLVAGEYLFHIILQQDNYDSLEKCLWVKMEMKGKNVQS